jgi:hypothetical protein
MIVTENNCVADADGHIVAGPFPTNAEAWRWVDLNTDAGLEYQDRFNRIGRAYDGQNIEGL